MKNLLSNETRLAHKTVYFAKILVFSVSPIKKFALLVIFVICLKKMVPPCNIFQKDGATWHYFSKRWRHLALFFKKIAPLCNFCNMFNPLDFQEFSKLMQIERKFIFNMIFPFFQNMSNIKYFRTRLWIYSHFRIKIRKSKPGSQVFKVSFVQIMPTISAFQYNKIILSKIFLDITRGVNSKYLKYISYRQREQINIHNGKRFTNGWMNIYRQSRN